MRARTATRMSLGVAAAAVTPLSAALGPPPEPANQLNGAAAAEQPNVIVVFADDLGYADTSLYGGEGDTPNVARIADGGVTFTDGYVASPVCAPSRVGLLSGRPPARYEANSNFSTRQVLPDIADESAPGPSMPAVLQDAGYDTMAIGKWDISGVRRTFTEEDIPGQPNLPHEVGFDEYYGLLAGWTDYCPESDPEVFEYDGADDSYQRRHVDQYLTDELTDRAVDYVGGHAGRDDPFFLYLAYNAPHVPLQTPTNCPTGTFPKPEDDGARSAFEEMVRVMDDGIGRVMGALDAADGTMGNAETDPNVQNTIVVFLSDNGPEHDWQWSSGDLRGGKHTVFEGGLRVPYVVRWPARLDPGTTYDGMVSALDLLPTFAAAAGTPVDDGEYTGVDLVPPVRTGDVAHEQLAWRYYNDNAKRGGVPLSTVRLAVRSGDLKYLREVTPDGQVDEYVFDLDRDYDGDGRPDGFTEQVDESGDAAYADEQRRLAEDLLRWNEQNPVREDFEFFRAVTGVPDGWATYDGDWQVTDGQVLRAQADGTGTTVAAGTSFEDVSASADVRLTSDGEAGMLVRASDGRGTAEPLDGYAVTLASAPGRVMLTRVDGGESTVVRQADVPITPGETYLLRVTAHDGVVRASLDHHRVLSWTDPDPLPAGSIGLRATDTTAEFDNVHADGPSS